MVVYIVFCMFLKLFKERCLQVCLFDEFDKISVPGEHAQRVFLRTCGSDQAPATRWQYRLLNAPSIYMTTVVINMKIYMDIFS